MGCDRLLEPPATGGGRRLATEAAALGCDLLLEPEAACGGGRRLATEVVGCDRLLEPPAIGGGRRDGVEVLFRAFLGGMCDPICAMSMWQSEFRSRKVVGLHARNIVMELVVTVTVRWPVFLFCDFDFFQCHLPSGRPTHFAGLSRVCRTCCVGRTGYAVLNYKVLTKGAEGGSDARIKFCPLRKLLMSR